MNTARKLQILVFLSLLCCVAASTVLAYQLVRKNLESEFLQTIKAVTTGLVLSSEEAIQKSRIFLLQAAVNAAKKQTDVVYAYILDRSGTILAHSNRKQVGALLSVVRSPGLHVLGNVHELSLPIMDGKYGYVVVGVSNERVKKIERDIVLTLALAEGGIVSAAAGLCTLSIRWILLPIQRLRDAADRVGHADLSVQLGGRGGDELAHLTGAFNRMTASLRTTQEKSRQTHAHLLRMDKQAAVGQLSAGIAHEINNPLGVIMALSQLLLEEIPNESSWREARELLDKIAVTSSRCSEIVQNVLRLARPRQTLPPADLDVGKTLEDSLLLCRYSFEELGVALKADLPKNLPPLHGIASDLQQAFMSVLIRLAYELEPPGELVIQALPCSRPRPGIEIRFVARGRRHAAAPPFGRAEALSADSAQIEWESADQIVWAHGGKLDVENKIGEGVSVRFFFPHHFRSGVTNA